MNIEKETPINPNFSKRIKEKALELGFDACGISKVDYLANDAQRLKTWLSKGMHGEMAYMENYFDKRTDPRKLVENAKSVISVLLNYFPKETQKDATAPIISKYAYGEDYHHVIKQKLKQLLAFIQTEILPAQGRAFVDSAPVLDRAWATKSGLGWIGKNSNLISPKLGSFVFIGSLIVDTELEYDAPINDFCGGCNKCVQACPTNAIIEERTVDSRKCISYLTIEYKGESIPYEDNQHFKNRIFGCDICQDVCPWNRNAKPHNVEEFNPHPDLLSMLKENWQELTKEQFSRLFKNSAVKRSKYEGLKRNIGFVFSL